MVVRVGSHAMRVAPWPADPRAAQLSAIGDGGAPAADIMRSLLREVAAAGYGAAVTGALGADEQRPYMAAGFQPYAWLHLLDRDLQTLPDRPGAVPTSLRRIRRTEWPTVADVDARAFPKFWRLGIEGIVEARRATASSRLRVAVDSGGRVVGYAVFGRSGGRGFVQRIAVDPDCSGRGTGTLLMADGLHWLAARGATNALVNTQIDNERALQLYLRLGFRLLRDRLAVLGRTLEDLGAAR